MIGRTYMGLGKTSERISRHQLKRVEVCMNGSSINHGLMKMFMVFRSEESGQNAMITASKPNNCQ